MCLVLNGYQQLFEPPMGFCLWGLMMTKFFIRKVDTRDELLGPILDTAVRIQKSKDQLRRSIRDFRTRAAKCIETDWNFKTFTVNSGARGGAVGRGTALQAVRSRVAGWNFSLT